jgi:hypothetical protein
VAPNLSLVQLGETKQAGYRFLVDIRQQNWIGGAGIFFGSHLSQDSEGRPCWKWQQLKFERDPDPSKIRLVRYWATHDYERLTNVYLGNHGISTAFLDIPASENWYTLEIVSTTNGLNKVSWNGKPLPELTKNASLSLPPYPPGERPKWIPFTEADFIGGFGVIVTGAESSYGNARIMLFDNGLPAMQK